MLRLVSRLLAFCLAAMLLAGQAQAVIGMNREELIRTYGPVRETADSVYGAQFTDLIFLTRSAADGNSIIVAATMLDGRCQAVSYLKNDAAGKTAPLTPEELRNQMVASASRSRGTWQQLGPKEWRLEAGPEMLTGLLAKWPKPELFQIFTRDMILRGQVKP